MATVYRAFDQRLQVWRAIKVLLPQFARKRKLVARFETEAQTMALLEHTNIVRVYDVDHDGDHAYIVMEIVEGGSLVDWLEKHGPMPPRMAVDVTVEICQAIAFAHDKGVIHRDIKPHNVLVDRAGVCRVTDFGIARAGDTDKSLTKTGAVMGTWGYMAPEQRSDAKHVDERADVYATAATLYSLLTDVAPMDLFAADRDASILEGVPEPLIPVLIKATEYRKEVRYGSMRVLAAALLEVRDALPEIARGTPPLVLDVLEPLPAPPSQVTAAFEPDDPRGTILPMDDESEEARPYQDPVVSLAPAEESFSGAYERPDSTLHDNGPPVWRIALGLLLLGGSALFAGTLIGAADAPLVAPTPLVRPVEPELPSVVEQPTSEEEAATLNPEATPPAATPQVVAPTVPGTEATPRPAQSRPASGQPVATEPTAPEPTPAKPSVPRVEEQLEAIAADPARVGAQASEPEASQCFKSVSGPSGIEVGKTASFRTTTCLKEDVVLHYRATGGSVWYQKRMAFVVGAYSAVVSVDDSFAKGVEWYLSSAGVTSGSSSRPKRTPAR